MNFHKTYAALIISVCFCGIIFFTLSDYGITWDEGVYFHVGISYFNWLKNPSLKNIDAYWAINKEHPPLPKLLGGITNFLFHEKLKILNSISSFRLSILPFVFLSTYFLFLFAYELLDYRIAFITTALFFFLPRIFFHSHLGGMDYPITSLWLVVIYSYWKAMKDPKWIIVSSMLLGFALLAKINSFLIYIPLLFYWVLTHHGQLKCIMRGKSWLKCRESTQIFHKIFPLFIIPPIIFIAFWPWLWKDTFQRVTEYLSFHMHHAIVYVYYLGTQYPIAPWHYPWVLTFLTVPLIILAPFFIGLVSIIFRPNKTNIFLLLNAFLPLIMISFPSVPKYDGVRLFLPAFPFICMIAGMGLNQIFLLSKKIKMEKLFYLGFMVMFLLTIYSSIFKIHPYQSSYFNEVIGGVDGAAKKGFELEYWGNAYIGALKWLNAQPGKTFWVYMADLEPTAMRAFQLYKENGLLKKSIKFGNKDNSDYLILLIRQGFFNEEMWEYYKYKKPVFSVKLSQTNLVNIYKLK